MMILPQEDLVAFHSFGGVQSYPSRTKEVSDVDFSTGSVGLGKHRAGLSRGERTSGALGRMVALIGDAELDEGNIYEALQEGWKHDPRNVWWVIDYRRDESPVSTGIRPGCRRDPGRSSGTPQSRPAMIAASA